MLLQNWIARWASLALFLPLYLLRVPREERMMLDEFGEEYRAYMNRTRPGGGKGPAMISLGIAGKKEALP